MADAVRVQGLGGLRRAFRAAGKAESRELTRTLRGAAEPVRSSAAGLAASGIRRVGLARGGIDWSAMRVGTTLHSVYIAPRQRRTVGTPRKNLAQLLLDRAMLPALRQHSTEVERAVERMLGTVGRVWESTP